MFVSLGNQFMSDFFCKHLVSRLVAPFSDAALSDTAEDGTDTDSMKLKLEGILCHEFYAKCTVYDN